MEKITISCVNDGQQYMLEPGESLLSIAPPTVTDSRTGKVYPVLAAFVDHKLKDLDYKVYYPHQVEFIGYNHIDGRRTYFRSLSFLAQRAVRNLFPDKIFKINHSLPSGLYCKFRAEHISDEDIMRLREEMRRLVALDLPFTHKKILSAEAEAIFEAQNQRLKAGVQHSVGRPGRRGR